MLSNPEEKDYALEILGDIMAREKDDNEALVQLQYALVEKIAQIFLPIYEATGGKRAM